MNLSFNFNENNTSINLDKLTFFFGSSLSNKTLLANMINDGLQGKNKKFYCNYNIPTKNEYQVISINYKNSLLEEIKMGAKSYFTQYIKQDLIKNMDQNEINDYLSKINNSFSLINDILNNKYNFLPNTNISIQINDLTKLLIDYFTVDINEEDIPLSVAKILYISLILKQFDLSKKSFLIIDDFDEFLDISQLLKIIEIFNKNENIFIICFCKNSSLFNYINKDYAYYFIDNNNLISKQTLIEELRECILDYYGHHNNFPLILNEESNKLLFEIFINYSYLICDFYCSNNKEFILDFFENSNLPVPFKPILSIFFKKSNHNYPL